MIGDTYRNNQYYKKFAEKHPEMETSLRKKIDENARSPRRQPMSFFHGDLYKAYKIMRGYCSSDKDLLN